MTPQEIDHIECAIRHIESSLDVDPWAEEIAVEAMRKQIADFDKNGKRTAESAQNVSDGDLISRKAAIESIRECAKAAHDNHEWDMEQGYLNAIECVEEEPSAQPERKKSDWIPCSERLPNCNGCYLVWRPHFEGGEKGMPAICYFDGQNTWHDSYGVDFERTLQPNDVTAWMPLPDPYKGEQHEVD